MARIIRETQVNRPIGLALSVRQRRALEARDVSRFVKLADEAKPDKSGRLIMSFSTARDLIAARFKRLREVFA